MLYSLRDPNIRDKDAPYQFMNHHDRESKKPAYYRKCDVKKGQIPNNRANNIDFAGITQVEIAQIILLPNLIFTSLEGGKVGVTLSIHQAAIKFLAGVLLHPKSPLEGKRSSFEDILISVTINKKSKIVNSCC